MIYLLVCATYTSLFSTSRLYRDRQKPANRTQCPPLSHVDMITHGMPFAEQVDGTGWSKLMTHNQQVNCEHGQSKEKTTGMNHQSSDHTVPTLQVKQSKYVSRNFLDQRYHFCRPKLPFVCKMVNKITIHWSALFLLVAFRLQTQHQSHYEQCSNVKT